MAGWIFVATVVSTIFCMAVNLYTWRLAYPLWGFAGASFHAVHREYMRRLTPVITVPHVLMFLSALAGCFCRLMPGWAAWLVFALNAGVVVISAAVAGSVHGRFERDGFEEAGLRLLVRVSAWRSVMMIASCAVLVWVMLRLSLAHGF